MLGADPDATRFFLYALGGGLGHLTRATALGRVLARQGRKLTLLTNSPLAPAVPIEDELGPGGKVVRLSSKLERESTALQVDETLRKFASESRARPVLVVDTFPRGLGGELERWLDRFDGLRVLIARDLTPAYGRRPEVCAAAARYDLAIGPGELAEGAEVAQAVLRTAPFLVRDRHELVDRQEARCRLGIEKGEARRVVAVVGEGSEQESVELDALAVVLGDRLRNRAVTLRISLHGNASHCRVFWPFLELLQGVDVVVGAGGYNTVWETRAVGVPLLALPRRRRYDRQSARLRREETLSCLDEALSRVERTIDESAAGRQGRPIELPAREANGVHRAIEAMDRLVAGAGGPREGRQSDHRASGEGGGNTRSFRRGGRDPQVSTQNG